MNNSSMGSLQGKRKIRLGMMKAKIGSRHVMKGPDGIKRSFTVRDKSRHSKANMKCVCLTCKQIFSDEEELLEQHPANADLRKQQESHVYAWWSDDTLEKQEKSAEVKPSEPKAEKAKIAFDPKNVIGLLSDEEFNE